MLVIGITGRARSGKNTIAGAIHTAGEARGLTVISYEISDYVLEHCKRIGLLDKNLERKDLTPYQIEVLVEQGLRIRRLSSSYWIERIAYQVAKDSPDIAVIPNIRFINEAEAVRSMGTPGVIVRSKALIRDGIEYISEDRDPNSIMEIENYQIEADYFLSVKKGQSKLLKMQATALFEYILTESNN